MRTRRAALGFLTLLLFAGAVLPAAAAPRRHSVPRVTITTNGPGTLIAVRYGSGLAERVRFVYAREAIERVAVADIDNDGDFDIIAAPRDDGALMLWRNAGHGRYALATLPRDARRVEARGPHVARAARADDEWQSSDDGHDVALPRAPDAAGVPPASAVRVVTSVSARRASFRRFSDRAPPVL